MSQKQKPDGKKAVEEVKQVLRPGERFIKDMTADELRDAFIVTVRKIERIEGLIRGGQQSLRVLQQEYAGVNAELAQRETQEKKG